MDFKQLEDVFWQITAEVLGRDFKKDNIRLTYPIDGQTSWEITEDIVFIRLFEKEDSYAKQLDSFYQTEYGTVIKKSARTRIWDVQFVIYGPNSHTNANKIKDGMFIQKIHCELAKNNIFLIPDLPSCRRVPELFAGQWWERWDINLSFNELYLIADEDVGHIDSVTITTKYNR